MTATLISCEQKQAGTFSCAYTAAETAAKLGVSVTTVRRAAKRLGVRKIAGRAVAGFVRFAAPRVDVVLPYSD